MAKKKRGGLVAGILAGVLAFGLAGVALAAGRSGVPRPTKPPYKEGPGGKGKVFGGGGGIFGGGGGRGLGGGDLPPGLPEDFDFGGNGLWISPDCAYVVEGNLFWQSGSFVSAVPGETLDAALAVEGNSVLGLVDWLIEEQGYRHPEEIAWEVLRQASPLCADVDPELWGEGLAVWFNNFVERLIPWVEEAVTAIGGFDPTEDDELDDGPIVEDPPEA